VKQGSGAVGDVLRGKGRLGARTWRKRTAVSVALRATPVRGASTCAA